MVMTQAITPILAAMAWATLPRRRSRHGTLGLT